MAEEKLTDQEIQDRIKLMKENCIFCKIVNKEIPSKVVFEDELTIAILDINPATKGHLLLMPKEHYMMMPMAPDEVLGHMSIISKYLSDLLKQSLNAKDTTLYIANGAAAGQQSNHFMMHLIPRYDGDGIDFNLAGEKLSSDELEKLKGKIQAKLQSS